MPMDAVWNSLDSVGKKKRLPARPRVSSIPAILSGAESDADSDYGPVKGLKSRRQIRPLFRAAPGGPKQVKRKNDCVNPSR